MAGGKEDRLKSVASETRLLLKGGLIVDGTGKKGFSGDLLIRGDKITEVSERPIEVDCETIDCTGKVIAPGFIDVHSHMDRILAFKGHENLKIPFTAQGCTTFVAGNCGFSAGCLTRNSKYQNQIVLDDKYTMEVSWESMAGYFDYLKEIGITHNVINLAGNGTVRASMRGLNADHFSPEEMNDLLRRLDEAMDQGAAGVSFGLGYAPDIFCTTGEIEQVARLVKKRDKIVTVHGRAYSLLSGSYPREKEGLPHNVLSLMEMIDVARQTGVRLQYSHLMFAGSKSHQSYTQCLEVLDQAIADGVDVMIDTYPYHCGYSVINVVLPPWFLADLPANFQNDEAVERVERGLTRMPMHNGFGFEDIQIMHADHPDLTQFNGMFISEIAEELGISPARTILRFSEWTEGRTRILNHNYSNMEIIDALIRHPACLFMTDSTVSVEGLQNPASFGSFPLLLQYARDRNLISLEEAVRKMTGASAERLKIKDRGFLKKGLAADITVFDWGKIKDNNTVTQTDRFPTGIEAVFINGRLVKKDNELDDSANAGMVIEI